MRLWIGIAAIAIAAAAAVLVVMRPHAADPLAEFHAGERASLTAFNDALHRQRANDIDEHGLADAIERDVLPRWRDMRGKVDPGALPPAMQEPMRRYLADRQTAWEAYVAALRAPSDDAARPHYDAYHQADAAADADAHALAAQMH